LKILQLREIPLYFVVVCYDMIYLLNTIGLTRGGSSTVHIYTPTMHRTTHIATENTINNYNTINKGKYSLSKSELINRNFIHLIRCINSMDFEKINCSNE